MPGARRPKPKGDPPSKAPKIEEPPPRDGGGPAPDSPTGRTSDGRRRKIERGGIGRSDPARHDRAENHESRDERPHAPSVAPAAPASRAAPSDRKVSNTTPDPDHPFC